MCLPGEPGKFMMPSAGQRASSGSQNIGARFFWRLSSGARPESQYHHTDETHRNEAGCQTHPCAPLMCLIEHTERPGLVAECPLSAATSLPHLIHLVIPVAQDCVIHLTNEVDEMIVQEIVVAVYHRFVRLNDPQRHVGRWTSVAVSDTPRALLARKHQRVAQR